VGVSTAANEVSLGEIISVVRQIARYVRGLRYAMCSTRSITLWSDCEKKKRNENENSVVSGENIVFPELPRRENISLRIVVAREELFFRKVEYMQYF
jgi:hypothetical protein